MKKKYYSEAARRSASVKDMSEKTIMGKDKATQYNWNIQDTPGELMMINKKLINIDPEYQRTAKSDKILELASNWSWVACGAIIIGRRDRKYWAIDGQHRVIAAMKNSKIQELPCIVFNSTSQITEANGFLRTNRNRKPITSYDAFQAMLTAQDENALFVKHQLDKEKLSLVSKMTKAGQISCVGLCLRLSQQNRNDFIITIGFTNKLCAEIMGITDRMLLGMAYIHSHVESGLKNKKLLTRIINAGPSKTMEGIQRAASYYAAGGGKVFAQGILDTANRGLKNKFRFIGDEESNIEEEE